MRKRNSFIHQNNHISRTVKNSRVEFDKCYFSRKKSEIILEKDLITPAELSEKASSHKISDEIDKKITFPITPNSKPKVRIIEDPKSFNK